MRISTGFAGALAYLALVDEASARVGARASGASAGGILRDSRSPKQYDGISMPQIDANLGMPVKLEGDAVDAAVAVTGGQQVQEVISLRMVELQQWSCWTTHALGSGLTALRSWAVICRQSECVRYR